MAFPIVLNSLHSIQTCSEGSELGGLRDKQKELFEKQSLASCATLALCNARFTLADPMPQLCPDAVGGESGSAHPMHARPGPCRAGHHSHWPTCLRIVGRSGSGVVFIMTPFPVYLFDSRRTCFVQHLRIQSFTHTLLFVFVFLCSSSS